MDMDGVVEVESGKRRKPEGTMENPIDLPFESLRSFAVDYSGMSGAPGFFVVVDRLTGDTPQKVWVMHTQEQVMVEGNSFILKANSGATMRGTFVALAQVKIDIEETQRGRKILASGGKIFLW